MNTHTKRHHPPGPEIGNVLVTVQDREPEPKIVDFGLAKAFGKAIDAESGHTVVGEFLGTPTYMSPEQFA